MKNIEENNRIIADSDLMGFEKIKSHKSFEYPHHYNVPNIGNDVGGITFTRDLKFHESWDWLMPVYSKLLTLMWDDKGWCYFKPDQFKDYYKGPNEYIEFVEEFGLRLMRNAPGESCEILVKMIKWYNEQKDV